MSLCFNAESHQRLCLSILLVWGVGEEEFVSLDSCACILTWIFACWVIRHGFLSSADFFLNKLFRKKSR